MTVRIKGTKSGLLLHLQERPLAGAVVELRDRLASLPGFYKGSRAVLMLGSDPAEQADVAAVIATLEEFGIAADGAVCDTDAVSAVARAAGLRLVGASIAAAPRIRDDRTEMPERRREREGGRTRKAGRNGHASASPETGTTLYYKGTVRSGQALSSLGNIIVVGDVNAGAELTAAGDIVVWGALRGVAHAGAEGDDTASVAALSLEPMQLRISRAIAVAPDDRRRRKPNHPEVARLCDGRIITENVRLT